MCLNISINSSGFWGICAFSFCGFFGGIVRKDIPFNMYISTSQIGAELRAFVNVLNSIQLVISGPTAFRFSVSSLLLKDASPVFSSLSRCEVDEGLSQFFPL